MNNFAISHVLLSHLMEHCAREADRRTLYVSPLTKQVEGLPETESRALLAELLAYTLKPEHIYRHAWRMGDMLLYDNAQLLHRREAFTGLRWLKATRVFVSPRRFAVPN